MTEPEEWRVIVDFPDYEVSDLGRVRRRFDYVPKGSMADRINIRLKAGFVLSPSKATGGYPLYGIYKNGKEFNRLGHVIVCEAFHGPRPTADHEVAHFDGVPSNIVISNLRWATPKENSEDRTRHGRAPRGSKTRKAILVESQVLEIRRRLATGATCKSLAIDYGVSREAINLIKMKRNWAWLEDLDP